MRLALCALSIAIAVTSFADVATLKNGERITGKLVSMTAGSVTFESESFGRVKFPWTEVSQLETDESVLLVLADGTRIQAKIEGFAAGDLLVSASLGPQRLVPGSLTSINPPVVRKAPVRWEGSLSSTLGLTRTNTESQNFDINLDLVRASSRDKLATKASYAYARQSSGVTTQTTRDRWSARGQYDYVISDQTYWFGSARLDRDRTLDLDLRTVLSAGAGYLVFDSPRAELAADLGLSWVRETYAGAGEEGNMAAAVGTDFRYELLSWLTLVHDLEYYPNSNDLADYFLSSELGLRSKLASNLFADFKFLFDYDASPAPGARKDNYKYFLGIGVRF